MTDEHGILQIQFPPNLDGVLGVAGKRRILSVFVGSEVGASSPNVIKKHNFEIVFELGRNETPHVLIAAEAVGENHSPVAVTTNADVVSNQEAQRLFLYVPRPYYAGLAGTATSIPSLCRRADGTWISAERGTAISEGRRLAYAERLLEALNCTQHFLASICLSRRCVK
jgi:hypothetical protein